MTPADWRSLKDLLLAYLLVLATPGPNMLLVAATAALRGVGGALPLCLGISLGAGALNAAILVLVSAAPEGSAGLDARAGRLFGAALLLWVAVSVARGPPIDARRLGRGGRVAGFAAGFVTAATNPVTAALFGAQFLGPLAAGGGGNATVAVLAPLAVAAEVLCVMLGVAVLLAHPAFRRAALAWQRPVRLAAAVALAFMALSTAATTLL